MKLIVKIFLVLLLAASSHLLNAQTANTWTQLNYFSGASRKFAVSFVVNNTAYVGTGLTDNGPTNDFWQYNPVSDTWSQKANASPYPRHGAVGFAINNKGYMGTGDISTGNYEQAVNDFWEYDPIA